MTGTERKEDPYRCLLCLLQVGEGRHQAWSVPFTCIGVSLAAMAEGIAIKVCRNVPGTCDWWAFGPGGKVAEGSFRVGKEEFKCIISRSGSAARSAGSA